MEMFFVYNFLPSVLDDSFNDEIINITISTYEFNIYFFNKYFYNSKINYKIYCNEYYGENINNLNIIILNNNHAKFIYIEGKLKDRLIITSCNITKNMCQNCIQSVIRITKSKSEEINHEFFDNYNLKINKLILNKLNLLYCIPNKVNTIQNWLDKQDNLHIICNNVNFNYMKQYKNFKIYHFNNIPFYSDFIKCFNYSSERSIECNYLFDFHYKLYFNSNEILISSNNFSLSYKNNYELGVLLNY